jgi:hypothetical protein
MVMDTNHLLYGYCPILTNNNELALASQPGKYYYIWRGSGIISLIDLAAFQPLGSAGQT